MAERFGCTVHVLDDGFQHLQLARDLDILVATVDEIENGRVIPIGRLREPRDAARSADILVVTGATPEQAAAAGRALGIANAFAMTRELGHTPVRYFFKPETKLTKRVEYFEDKTARVLAVAGIGRPEQFHTLLKDNGWNIVDTMWFRDHHQYTAGDVAAIDARLRASGAAVVLTTSKDFVRFEAVGDTPFPLFGIGVMVNVDRPEEFFGLIAKAVA
jgi:tetraacyldisaccharide 4'-kinase